MTAAPMATTPAREGGPCSSMADTDYPNQPTRGDHYASDLNAIFNTRRAPTAETSPWA